MYRFISAGESAAALSKHLVSKSKWQSVTCLSWNAFRCSLQLKRHFSRPVGPLFHPTFIHSSTYKILRLVFWSGRKRTFPLEWGSRAEEPKPNHSLFSLSLHLQHTLCLEFRLPVERRRCAGCITRRVANYCTRLAFLNARTPLLNLYFHPFISRIQRGQNRACNFQLRCPSMHA